MSQRKNITQKDVAQALGVHSSTVSRVMNPDTRHMVSAEVAQRVLKAVRELGYRPNKIASTLRTRRSNTVGVILPDISNPVFPPMLSGIEDTLAEKGYVPLVANAGRDRARQRLVIDQMLGRQVDGLILAAVERRDRILDHCLEEGIPVVAVNRSEDIGRVSSVVSDDRLGMRLAVEYLVGLGHRRIGHIAGPQTISTGYMRKLGFIESARSCGLADDECCIVECSAYSREAGRVACTELLLKFPSVTAIAAGNDLIALGCYDTLREQGRVCPDEISVVGYNDMPMLDLIAPPLTTIHIPLHEMGVQAAKLILGSIVRTQKSGINVMLRPELVVRGSTAVPPSSPETSRAITT